MVEGLSYKTIAGRLPSDADVSVDSMRRHLQMRHLPVEAEGVQQLQAQNAAERGKVVERGAQVMVEHVTFARGVLRRVQERLASGELEPDLKDGLAAAQHLARFDVDAGVDQDAMLRALRALMETAKAIMNEGQWLEFSRRLTTNETIKDLSGAP